MKLRTRTTLGPLMLQGLGAFGLAQLWNDG